jgi:glutamine synthetase
MSEINSRAEILLEKYVKEVHIEALTAIDMARKEIAPAVIGYEKFLIEELALKNSLGRKISSKLEEKLIDKLAELTDRFSEELDKLILDEENFKFVVGTVDKARYCRDDEILTQLDFYTSGAIVLMGAGDLEEIKRNILK